METGTDETVQSEERAGLYECASNPSKCVHSDRSGTETGVAQGPEWYRDRSGTGTRGTPPPERYDRRGNRVSQVTEHRY